MPKFPKEYRRLLAIPSGNIVKLTTIMSKQLPFLLPLSSFLYGWYFVCACTHASTYEHANESRFLFSLGKGADKGVLTS